MSPRAAVGSETHHQTEPDHQASGEQVAHDVTKQGADDRSRSRQQEVQVMGRGSGPVLRRTGM